MTPQRWQQIDQLFHSALAREPKERAAFLDQACNGDTELRREVESLLAAEAEAESTTKALPAQVAAQMLTTASQQIGHYRVLAPLGAGGMGEVFLAQDTRLGRKIALKLLPAQFTQEAERVRRFEQEARAASALNHPNIITIHEIGQTDATHFIVTEYVEGQTLRQQMKATRMNLPAALEIAIQIATALSAAHDARIIHRDIKPENVMIRSDGIVKVLDFGLAKLTEQASGEKAEELAAGLKTASGVVMGTPRYMSPEQARGQKVDARTDIFSLGVMLYEMIAGRRPFEGATPNDVMAAILATEPEQLSQHAPDVPPDLERIVAKALRKDREERYQTVKDLLVDLKDLKQELEIEAKLRGKQPLETAPPVGTSAHATDDAVQARTISSAGIILSELKRHKRGVALSLAAMLALAGGLGFWLYKLISRNNASTASPALKITRLTHTGKATRAAISPDGRYVVCVRDEAGQQSLWLIQVATASDERILPPAEVNYRGITFSHDGNFIYYVRDERNASTGTLYLKPVLGGAEKKLLANVDSPVTLSPNGKQLAFVRLRMYIETLLMTANADGTEEKKLAARTTPDSFAFTGPAWSPDGRMIACATVNFSERAYVSVVGVNVGDGTATPITSQQWPQAEGRTNIGRMAWRPDNSGLIVTTAEQEGGQPQIWHLPYPQGGARRITTDLNDYADISLTANTETIAAVRFERLINIWTAPSGEASRARQITSGSGREDGTRGLAWTPDGRIVYRSIAGGQPHIWLMEADGGGNRQLSVGARNNIDPAVSPDGRYVVWGSNPTGIYNIWQMDIDGGNPRQLTHGKSEWFPQYSPDGNWLVYRVYFPGPQSLWKLPFGGGSPVQLTNEIAWMPVISPDGKLIACNYRDRASTPKWQIAIIPFAGGQPRFIESLDPSLWRRIRWTPDGRALAYPVTRGGVSNLWTQPFDGSPPKQLTEFRDGHIFDFAWSRDGKQIALSRGLINSDVVLISNFK